MIFPVDSWIGVACSCSDNVWAVSSIMCKMHLTATPALAQTSHNPGQSDYEAHDALI